MDIAENLAHSREELFVIFFHGLRRTLFDKRDLVDYEIKARSDVILELTALDRAHIDKSFERFGCDIQHIGAYLFLILRLFRDGEYIVYSCEVGHLYVVLYSAGLRELIESRQISLCERSIELDNSRFFAGRIYLNVTLDLAS